MKVLHSFGKSDIAIAYIADFGNDRVLEFVESLQPPVPRKEKWVLIISTSFGCSVKCLICDAGGDFRGRCSTSQMFAQLDYIITRRFPDHKVDVKKFKIQFARMGEPAFNNNVLDVLDQLKEHYDAPGLMPCISTIAPAHTEKFFERLLKIKSEKYNNGNFQLQFSLHSSNQTERDRIMPVSKWSLEQIAAFGEHWYEKGDRKITLNFALIQGMRLDPNIIINYFSPEYFLIKLTPVNPTYSAMENRLASYISVTDINRKYPVIDKLRSLGFDTIISIGENEENHIGSNCGQFIMKHMGKDKKSKHSYTYTNVTQ